MTMLETLRKMNGLTQIELAEKARVSRSTIQRLETPDGNTARNMERLLKLLLTGEV